MNFTLKEEKLLILNNADKELQYEAKTSVHAKDWISIIEKYKNFDEYQINHHEEINLITSTDHVFSF